jgi:glycosyltransferase involved in cell wall biosynthesis
LTKLCIGILAYNEEKNLPITLNSVLSQSVCQPGQHGLDHVEILIVPNACKDNTATVARQLLEATCANQPKPGYLSYKVDELEKGGIAYAMNHLFHHTLPEDADFIVKVDADIEFYDKDVLARMVASLQQNPELWLNGGNPVKSIALKPNKTPLEWLSVKVSQLSESKIPRFSGQLFMLRAEKLKQLAIPNGLNGEDGYLHQMISTLNLTVPFDPYARMVNLDTPSHTFEAYLNVAALMRHEKELIKSILGHGWLFDHLRQQNESVNDFVRRQNAENPNWLDQLFEEKTKMGWWFIPAWMWWRRFITLFKKPLLKQIVMAPVVLMATLLDWWAMWLANKDLNSKVYQQYWR